MEQLKVTKTNKYFLEMMMNRIHNNLKAMKYYHKSIDTTEQYLQYLDRYLEDLNILANMTNKDLIELIKTINNENDLKEFFNGI